MTEGDVVVPVNGDWRVPLVMGDEEGWSGVCHPVVAWRIPQGSDVADPVYPSDHVFDENDGDLIGEPHRAHERCLDKTGDAVGLVTITEHKRLCPAMQKTWWTLRVRQEMARRRTTGLSSAGGE